MQAAKTLCKPSRLAPLVAYLSCTVVMYLDLASHKDVDVVCALGVNERHSLGFVTTAFATRTTRCVWGLGFGCHLQITLFTTT